jgi:Fe-S-cluster containining protein
MALSDVISQAQELLPFSLLEPDSNNTSLIEQNTNIIGLNLNILGKPLHLDIAASDTKARLADIVPLATAVSEKIQHVITDNISANGQRIPCQAGCCTCCRFIIPLSVPEVFRMREYVFSRTTFEKNLIIRSFLLAARKVFQQKPPYFILDNPKNSEKSNIASKKLSDWYLKLNLYCPFLCDGLCTAYEDRPVACREHLVTGSSRGCRGQKIKAKVVPIPVSMVDVLGKLTAELEGAMEEAVMLPLAFLWYEHNLHRDLQTWPAAEIVEKFVQIAEKLSLNDATMVPSLC